jgi:hypothetical protein
MSADSQQTEQSPQGASDDAGGVTRRRREAWAREYQPRPGAQSECMETNRFSDPRLGDPSSDPLPALTEREIAEIEERARERRQYWDTVYASLKRDARSTARSMRFLPFGKPEDWDEIMGRSLDDYRSGRSLMDHLGADRLIDPALSGMLLAIRRGLIEEVGATSMADYVLVDMVVIAFANTMRIQSMIGNTALILESEMFCQPTLRARWKKDYGYRPEDIRGLAVDDHVARLRDNLLPLAERFHRMAEAGIEGLRRQRREPSIEVERAVPISLRIVCPA